MGGMRHRLGPMAAEEQANALVEEATFDFTLGDHAAALEKLAQALELQPDSFEAWHAKAEIHFSERDLEEALAAADRALALRPDDLFIHTTLSRIWMERGDKPMAEKYGARAKILSWKDQLKNPQQTDGHDLN
jgi:tetratricopeptide (TPR) repeat protein